MSDRKEDLDAVDRAPENHVATEADEEFILAGLYGPPDEHGFYTGEAL